MLCENYNFQAKCNNAVLALQTEILPQRIRREGVTLLFPCLICRRRLITASVTHVAT